jgi:hypothetical protein
VTWLKLSDDFSDELARFGLSDAAFRTHTEALGWVMRRETGGEITERDVLRFAESTHAVAAIRELCDLGLWQRIPGGYTVRHHMEHQTEPAVLAARRSSDAVRQRRVRHKRAGLTVPDGTPQGQSNGVSHGVTSRVTLDGSGLVGSGTPTPLLDEPQDRDPWSQSDAPAVITR